MTVNTCDEGIQSRAYHLVLFASRRENVSAIPSCANDAAVVLVCDCAMSERFLVITCNTAKIPTENTNIAMIISMKVNQWSFFVDITYNYSLNYSGHTTSCTIQVCAKIAKQYAFGLPSDSSFSIASE